MLSSTDAETFVHAFITSLFCSTLFPIIESIGTRTFIILLQWISPFPESVLISLPSSAIYTGCLFPIKSNINSSSSFSKPSTATLQYIYDLRHPYFPLRSLMSSSKGSLVKPCFKLSIFGGRRSVLPLPNCRIVESLRDISNIPDFKRIENPPLP